MVSYGFVKKNQKKNNNNNNKQTKTTTKTKHWLPFGYLPTDFFQT